MARSAADPSPSSSSPTADPWGTWEDLLLACAVSRHGSDGWAAVALEVQSRCPHISTSSFDPGSCRARFDLIHRRFDCSAADGCVEELRRVRVAELRREVERNDLNIESLELKVKRLEEERERRIRDAGGGGDGDVAREGPTSSNPEHRPTPEEVGGGGESCKESNSTDLKAVAGEGGELHRAAAVYGAGEDSPAPADSDVQSSAAVPAVAGDGEEGASVSASAANPRIESQPLIKFLETIRSTKFGSVFVRRLESQDGKRYTNMIRRHVDLEMVQARLEQSGSSGGGAAYSTTAEFFRDLLLLCNNALVFFPKCSAEFAAAVQLRNLVSREVAGAPYRAVPLEDSTPLHKLLPPSAKLVKPKPDPDALHEKAPSGPPVTVCRKSILIAKATVKVEMNEKLDIGVKEDEEKSEKDKSSENDAEETPIAMEATTSKERTGARGLRTNKSRASAKISNASGKGFNPDPAKTAKTTESSDVETGKRDDKKRGSSSNANAAVNLAKKRNAVDFLNRLKQSPPSSTARVSLLETLKRSSDDIGSGGSKSSEQRSGPPPKKSGKGNNSLKDAGSKRSAGQGSKRGAAASMTPPPAKRLKGEQAAGKKRMRR